MPQVKTIVRMSLVVTVAAPFSMRAGGAAAAELVMFDSPACEWCEVWEEEVGIVYNKTEEACVAPIRRVSVYDERPDDLKSVRSIVFTPTFVLVEDGSEVGRILGYPGESHFWGLLGQMIQRIDIASTVSTNCERRGNTAANRGQRADDS